MDDLSFTEQAEFAVRLLTKGYPRGITNRQKVNAIKRLTKLSKSDRHKVINHIMKDQE